MELNKLIQKLEDMRDNMRVGETEVTFYCRDTDKTYVVDTVDYDATYGLIELTETKMQSLPSTTKGLA